jgi:hypothetical protein
LKSIYFYYIAGVIEESEQAYARGTEIAERQTETKSPSRLDLALSYSTFCYKELDDLTPAMEIARHACHNALADSNMLDREANHILDQLKDEITV